MKRVSLRRSRRAQSIRVPVRSRRPRPLGISLARCTSALAVAGALFASAGSASAAPFYWDTDTVTVGNNIDGTGLGGTGIWDNNTTANWWDLTNLVGWPNANTDHAIFTGPASILPTLNTVTLSSGIVANRLSFFRGGYTLTGGDLTLAGATPTLHANIGESATINSQILGSAGLIKTGGGSIRLNSGNTYTGTTTISNGSLIITSQSALGGDSSAIEVRAFNPFPTSAAVNLRGVGGGSLVLDGTGGNINISRNLSLQGRGPVGDNGAALISTGNNTLSGTVDMGVAFGAVNLNSRITSADGTLNITGPLNILGTAGTTISSLGGVNQAGAGLNSITGTLAGTGTLEGSGGGTLFLNPSDSSGFSGTIRVSGSAASGQSVVRIDSPGVLGSRTSGTTGAVLDMNGGILAVLMDTPEVKVSNGTNANVYFRTSSTIFADHTPNSSVKDQTVAFGNMSFEDNITLTFNSRNGYGMSFTTAPVNGGNEFTTMNNNLQGGALLSFAGNFWSNTDNGAARTMTIGGNGNTLINGSIIATSTSFNHNLIKSGTGTLTLTGTASTLDGSVGVSGGTVAINDWRAITNNTSNINLNGGTLSVIGNNVSLANLTTSKVINLSGTTGSATLLANQTGTSQGVIFNADFTATGVGTKTLTLGGTNIGANTINGAIVQNGTTNVTKVDGGRWVLAGTNTYTGTTTISNGTLQLKANAAASTILADTSVITFNSVNVFGGGTLEFVGQASVNNVETLGALTPTNGSGTVKLTPGSGGTASLVFASLGTVGGGGTVNIDTPTSSDTVKFTTTAITNNIANAGLYYNGSDFAFVPGAGLALRAPNYAGDADFATSATALTSARSMEITGAGFNNAAVTIDSLRINGMTALNMTGLLTIRTAGATNASGGIIQTGGSGTISGTGVTTGGSGALVINVDGGANSLTLNAPITSTTTGGFTKAGAGTLRLGGTNAQTGTISINEGTVRLAGADRLGAAASLTIRQDGILELNGVTPATNTNSFNNNGIVRNTSTTTDVTFTVGGSNGTGDSRGIIEDGGPAKVSVVKLGTGAQNWLGLSTYTGTTTIDSTGIVGINNLQNGGMPSGIGASSNAASNLIFTGTSATQAYAGLSFTGTTNDETDRLFTFNGGATGGVRIQSNGVNGATSSWTNTGALVFGANATGNAQGLVLGGASSGDNRFFPVINDNGLDVTSVYKADAGVWHLMATNGYSGATTLNAGTLYANDGSSLPTASNLVFNGGNFASTGAFSRTIGTGSGQMQWGAAASGGFSAAGSPLTVDWGAGNVWGTTVGFLGTGALLLNNSALAKAEVTITSGFDLGGATRTVTVGDNTNIGADVATLSGAITGTGGLIKNGAGILNLRGASTYTGNTAVTQGTLVVTSLGNSASPASTPTSVGVSGIGSAFDDTNAITLGNASTTAGILQYVGAGETSDRKIRINTTTGNTQIHSDGTGPLILTNVANDMAAGAKILFLRGTNAAGNMVTSQLSDNGGALAVTVDGSATWILTNGANNYTGTTSVNGGALGIGHDAAVGGGTGTLSISNGTVFAYGGDRTLSNPITQSATSGTIAAFTGEYSINLTGTWTDPSTTSSTRFIRNNIISGKTLTIGGAYNASPSVSSSLGVGFDGSGDTIVNGIISTNGTNFGVIYAGTGSLTLGGANTYTGRTRLTSGTVRLGANEVIPNGAVNPANNEVIFDPGVGLTATLDLNGKSETINGLTANSAGTANIDNTSATPASLVFGANDQPVNFGGGLGTYSIGNSGGGALSIVKTGTASALIPTGVTLTHTGATVVNGGGTMTIASPVNGTTSLIVASSGSALALTGGLTTPAAVTNVVVENGTTLSLLDGAGNKLSGLNTLQLGSAGGTNTSLNFNVGDLNVAGDELSTDTLVLNTAGTLSLVAGNKITFNLTDTGLSANETYELLNFVDGGFTSGPLANTDYLLGATPGGFTSFIITANNNSVFVTTGNLIVGTTWWNAGGVADNWNDVANWAITDKTGTIPAVSTPGQGNDVVFIADNLTGGAAITTTLEQNFKVNSLTFEASTIPANTPVSVTIDPGVDPTKRIEIAPQASTDGIKITAGGPATVTISGPVRLGGVATSQTWGVADAASTLSLGSLAGERDVTKSGLGKVRLIGAADATFNMGDTADFTINAGTLEMTNVAALGDPVNGNFATVTVNSTGAFYYNGAASSATNLAMPITLAGGTLSAGTATQNYSGAVNVSAASTINMAENNGAPAATARSITLSGPLSGSGDLTVNSNDTVSSGNQLSGTLTISNAGNTWSGDLLIDRGTVTFATAASPAFTNDLRFNQFGRVIIQNTNGNTLNRTGTLTYATGAVGEIQVDNTGISGGPNYTVTQSGAMSLGTGGTGASARLLMADSVAALEITGGVTLGGNSSISVAGGDADSFVTISSPISDGGSGYSLAINDDAGGWGQTNTILRLTGLNTFTGNLTVDSGTLQFDTVTNIGGAASSLGQGSAITMGGGSARLSFIGGTSQSTNRPITTVTGAQTLSAEGTGGATITYAGAITVGPTADGSQVVLTGLPGSAGIISGGITMTGDSADMTINGGTWTHQTGTSRVGNDVVVTGATTIFNLDSGLFQLPDDLTVTAGANLNLNGTGVLSFNTPTLVSGSSLTIYAGGIATFGANDPVVSTEFDSLRVGTDTAAGIGTVNMATFNQTVAELTLGNRNLGFEGLINGTGILTVTGNFDVYRGTINANLASSGTNAVEKYGTGTVTLRGNNSGLASTGSTTVIEGTLVLDYTADNNVKVRAASQLDMRGSNLQLIGNNGAATSQSVGSFTLGSGGSDYITLTPGAGQEIVLNLGAITRANGSQDGTVRFVLPSGVQSATNGITTTSPNSTFGLLGTGAAPAATTAYATVQDGSGVWFATSSAGKIVGLASTPKNDVTTWLADENLTDETTGFTGTIIASNINSLRFNASGGSDLLMPQGGILNIGSGGFLITSSVGGTPSLTGGTLASSTAELLVIQDSGQTFEIGSDIRINHGVTKSGPGTLLLSGNNVYTDETEIHDGTLQVAGTGIGDNSIVTLAANRASTLELLADETIGRLQGGQRNTDSNYGTVAVGSNTLTIIEGASTTYAGVITGTGGLIKQGPGNLQLTNLSNGFTGVVTVESGTLYFTTAGQLDANIYRVNKGAALLFDQNGTTTPTSSHIPDGATITLNSADGGFAGSAAVRGLALRTDQDTARDETVGVLNLNTGASYVGMEATTSSDDSDIIINNLVRLNDATLNVRGTNLGGASSQENEFRIGDTTNQTAFIASAANLVGGGGAATTKNINIVPWAIGESYTGGLGINNMGNSLVTYTSGSGFRPLDAATEYNTIALAAATDNARESLAADLTGLAGTTLNALVLNNAATPAINVTGTGAGQTLEVTSGAMLFTMTGATANTAYSTTLGGFDTGITVGGTNEYVIHVVNPNSQTSLTTGGTTIGSTRVTVASTAGLQPGMALFGSGIPVGARVASVTSGTVFEMTLPSVLSTSSQTFGYTTLESLTASISSPLTSAADITKSGRGTLILSNVNTAGGGANKTTINEGTLEIADLDNIGGNTGALVFAGGALRLGVGLTDDISQRTITLLDGGGTLDTNGIDLALANTVGSGLGGLTKIGLGNLTLNAAATYLGATTILGGTLTVGANNATGGGGDLNVGAGATLALGTNSITAGLVSAFGVSPTISGTGTITASRGFFFGNTGDTTVSAVLAGPGGLFKQQGSVVLTLNGLNTYAGTTELQAGTISFDSIANVGGGASALGAPTTVENGIIRLGLTTTSVVLTYTGSGHSSDRIIGLQGSTGGATINANGTGALGLGRVQGEAAGTKTVVFSGTSATPVLNSIGVISDGVGKINVTKSGTNTWVFNQPNTYTGTTTVADGILGLAVDQTMTGGLVFGAAGTAGLLGMPSASAQFPTMTVVTNSAVLTNTATIGAGETLTINGNVTIGANAVGSATRFTADGGGAFVNTNDGGTFQVGGATGSSNTNAAVADFSALATFTADLGATGTFRVGDNSAFTGGGTGTSVLTLSPDNTITAGSIQVAAVQANALQTLHLGSGTNTLKAGTLDVGGNTRGIGLLDFATGTGTMSLRAADGTSAAVMNLGASTTGTGANITGTVDLSGHSVDLLVSTLTMADRSQGVGVGASATTATMTFDDGLLNVTTATLGRRTSTGTGSATATLNLGDGAVAGTPSTTIGTLNMAINTSAGGAVVADLNVTGGNVAIGTGSGTAINMATANASRTVTSTIDLTGGVTTVTGNIVRTGGAGTENATITLAGGGLNMSGFAIGTGAANIALVAEAGTLSNLSELNGGGTLTKTTGGTVVMAGSNTYTGPTAVSAGVLEISGSISGTSGLQVDNTGTLLLSGVGGEQVNNAATLNLNGGTLAFGTQSGVTETLGALILNANSIIDFGIGDSNTFLFSNLSITGGSTLSIYNWTGTPYSSPFDVDHGGNQDRLVFDVDVSAQTLGQISFYSDNGGILLGSGAQIVFGGDFQIVPVPEPSSTALLGAAGLLALVGYRERRRLSGALQRKSKAAIR